MLFLPLLLSILRFELRRLSVSDISFGSCASFTLNKEDPAEHSQREKQFVPKIFLGRFTIGRVSEEFNLIQTVKIDVGVLNSQKHSLLYKQKTRFS